MKTRFMVRFWLIIFSVCLLPALSSGQPLSQSKKDIKNWYNQRAWLNGLKLAPHKSVNIQEFAKQYQARKEWWDKAFTYLRETDLASLTPGKHLIDGENVFATVTEGPTKDLDKTRWEAHKNYLDIHYVIRGKEKIGIAPFSTATVLQEYDSSKDIGFYSAKGKFYESDPGKFFIAFPSDAHRPGIKAEGSDNIKKVVIKIRTSS